MNSLRVALFCILIISASFKLAGQNNEFKAGVFVNFNGIHFEGQDKTFWSSTNGTVWGTGGISTGIFIKRDISNKIYAFIEFRYIQKGSIYEYTNAYAKQSFEVIRLHYAEIPLMIGTHLKVNRKKYYVETGFAFAEMFSSRFMIDELARRTGTPSADNFKTHDYSWINSVKIPFLTRSSDNFLFGLRVSYSLFSIHKVYKMRNFDYGIEFLYTF